MKNLFIISILVFFVSCIGKKAFENDTNKDLYVIEEENSESVSLNQRALNLIEDGLNDSILRDSLLLLASKHIDKSIQSDSTLLEAYFNKAAIYYYNGNIDSSISILNISYEKIKHPSSLFLIAVLLEGLKKDSLAKTIYRDALANYDSLKLSNQHLFTTQDELNREMIVLMLFGKDKAIKDLDNRIQEAKENDKKRLVFLKKKLENLSKEEIIKNIF